MTEIVVDIQPVLPVALFSSSGQPKRDHQSLIALLCVLLISSSILKYDQPSGKPD